MTITPSDLLEIERKARAYQAEEAANPDAKTCQRPTPELVLRLVEEVMQLDEALKNMTTRRNIAAECRDASYQYGLDVLSDLVKVKAERDALRVVALDAANDKNIAIIERDELKKSAIVAAQLIQDRSKEHADAVDRAETAEKERDDLRALNKVACERLHIMSAEHAKERDELRAKADALEAEATELSLENNGLRAKVAELEAIVAKLPRTADGMCAIGLKELVYPIKHSNENWNLVSVRVRIGAIGHCWGPMEVCLEDCYSTRAAAEAAKGK